MKQKSIAVFFIALILAGSAGFLFNCNNGTEQGHDDINKPTDTATTLSKPQFNPDSAYAYIKQQVSFGPRVPGTAAQKKCADWMQQRLADFCDTVFVQNVTVKAGPHSLPCINLIGSINPAAPRRVLLLAHWDTRPWADSDTKNKDKPNDGADDGASGVGVLLELARQIKTQPLSQDIGIDILFADAEDYGKEEWDNDEGDSYGLGTQYWARHPHVAGYKADFGILLDMVGARNARFPLEGTSAEYAAQFQQQVWQAAGRAGYSSYFPFVAGPQIIDDHLFVNKLTGIPTIDIIHLTTTTRSGFAAHHHTHDDNLSIIDRSTLKAVGETLLQVIYEMVRPAA